MSKSYENIIVSRPENGVALFTLNRPKALNALNSALMKELNEAMAEADEDREVKAMIVTGSDKAFAGVFIVCWDICGHPSVDEVRCLLRSWG